MAENPIPKDVSHYIARNEKLVERIVELGGDLAEPRAIDFFFYVPEQQDAELLSAELRELSFRNVHTAAAKDQWSVTGEYRAPVSEITDVAFVERLASLAAKYLGEFDGWGTGV